MRATTSVSGLLLLLLLASFAVAVAGPAAAQAPSGEAVYKQNCAACHEGNLPPRTPPSPARMLQTEAGGLLSVNLADGKPRWTAPPSGDTCGTRVDCNTGQPAAVSAMPGVVFSGALDGHLRAYDAASGKVIWDVDTAHAYMNTVNRVPAGGGMNGPGATVAGGMLFVNSGYGSIGSWPATRSLRSASTANEG